jgi:hypothetical protein
MSLKEELADLFIKREQLRAQTEQTNQQLQIKLNELSNQGEPDVGDVKD